MSDRLRLHHTVLGVLPLSVHSKGQIMSTVRRLRVLLALLVTLASSHGANGAVIFNHVGNNNPSTEGFTNFGTTGTPVTGAWQINGGGTASGFLYSAGGYSSFVNSILTPTQQTQMNAAGWTASWNVEVVNNSVTNTPRGVEGNLFVNNNVGHGERYSLRFGRSTDAGAVNATGTAFQISLNGGVPFTFPGQGSGLHLIKLVTTGSTDTASLYFDNTLVTTWAGTLDNGGGNYYAGDVASSPTSVSNWYLVQFEVNEVPEPASAALALAGIGAMLVSRRQRLSC